MKYSKNWFVRYDYALASKGDPRYSVFDSNTLKLLDDGNGFGYKTRENAMKSYGYRYKRSQFYLKSFGPYNMARWKEKFKYAMYLFAEALEDLGINTKDLRIAFTEYDKTGSFFVPEEQNDPAAYPRYSRIVFESTSAYRIIVMGKNRRDWWNLDKMMRPGNAKKYANWLINGIDHGL